MSPVGCYRNKDWEQQVLFEGLNQGLLCFSSIKACQEYKGKAYLFLIPKYGNTLLSTGQDIMYRRLVEDLSLAGKFVIAAIVSHETSQDQPIMLKDCLVSNLKIGFNPWRKPTKPITATQMRSTCIMNLINSA